MQNPPSLPLTTPELDRVYAMVSAVPITRSMRELGGVPGIKEVEFSIAHNQGLLRRL